MPDWVDNPEAGATGGDSDLILKQQRLAQEATSLGVLQILEVLVCQIEYKNQSEEKKYLRNPSNTMIITMNRFADLQDGHVLADMDIKISNSVSLPVGPTGETRVNYNVVTTVCHLGETIGSGHFICYGKHGGLWYEFDDVSG